MTPESNAAAKQTVTFVRTFDAPRELVFSAWTEPARMAQWWGPKGFTNPVCELDVRPGGAIRIHMVSPDGTTYPMNGTFREVAAPDRLVFISSALEDDDGIPALEILNTVTFAEHNGKTTVTIQAEVVKASRAAGFALDGMKEGWSQSLDRLRALLS